MALKFSRSFCVRRFVVLSECPREVHIKRGAHPWNSMAAAHPSTADSSLGRSSMSLKCVSQVSQLANSLELSAVPNSKPKDSVLRADPVTQPPKGLQGRPKKRSREDAASASTTSKARSSVCEHGQRHQCNLALASPVQPLKCLELLIPIY